MVDFNKGYSGHALERDMLGNSAHHIDGNRKREADRREAFHRDLRELQEKHAGRMPGYLPYDIALDFVRAHTPENPKHPTQPFARELLMQINMVIQERFRRPLLPQNEALFFSSVGTPLDVFHGIDAWVEVVDPRMGGYRTRVMLDVTRDRNKIAEGYKAQIIIPEIVAPTPLSSAYKVSEDEKKKFLSETKIFQERVRSIAEQIVDEAFGKQKWITKKAA